MTLAPIAERLAVELSLPVFTTYVCRDWDSNTQLSACGTNALTHRGSNSDKDTLVNRITRARESIENDERINSLSKLIADTAVFELKKKYCNIIIYMS